MINSFFKALKLIDAVGLGLVGPNATFGAEQIKTSHFSKLGHTHERFAEFTRQQIVNDRIRNAMQEINQSNYVRKQIQKVKVFVR